MESHPSVPPILTLRSVRLPGSPFLCSLEKRDGVVIADVNETRQPLSHDHVAFHHQRMTDGYRVCLDGVDCGYDPNWWSGGRAVDLDLDDLERGDVALGGDGAYGGYADGRT